MTTPLTNRRAPIVVNADNKDAVFALNRHVGGFKLQFGDITSLAGTISASWDDGRTYANILSITSAGSVIAAGGTITAADGLSLYFSAVGATHVKFTRTAGDGPVALVETFSADEHLAQLLRRLVDSGISTTPPAIQCYSFIADATDELLISSTARKLWGVDVFSLDATPVYVKLYDKATAPDENDTPIHRTGVPANSTASLGAGNNKGIWPGYIPLTNGLGVRAPTGLADNNDGTLTASEVIINVYWST